GDGRAATAGGVELAQSTPTTQRQTGRHGRPPGDGGRGPRSDGWAWRRSDPGRPPGGPAGGADPPPPARRGGGLSLRRRARARAAAERGWASSLEPHPRPLPEAGRGETFFSPFPCWEGGRGVRSHSPTPGGPRPVLYRQPTPAAQA